MSRRHYVTKARLTAVDQSLSNRQRSVMNDVARIGILSGRQLRALHYTSAGLSTRLARRELAGMVETEVLARTDRQIGGQHAGSDGYCYVLGLSGQRLTQPDRRRYWQRSEPGTQMITHALAVGQLYTDLRGREREGTSKLVSFSGEPNCWRRYYGPGGSPQWLKPDASAVIHVGDFEDRYFIEIDCATERPARIEAKARVYVRYYMSGREQAERGLFPIVVFVAPAEIRRSEIIDAIARIPAEHWHLFTVVTAKRAAGLIASGELAAAAEEAAS